MPSSKPSAAFTDRPKVKSSGKAVEAQETLLPLLPDGDGIGFLVRMAHRAFTRTLNQKLAQHDVASAQWSALRQLWKEDGYSQVELASRMRVEKPSLTFVLESMKEKGFITLERSAEDRRKSIVKLTQSGRALKTKLLPYADQVNAQATAGLSDGDIAVFKTCLQHVIRNLGN